MPLPIAIPIAMGAVSVVGSIMKWLSNKKQAEAQKEYNNLTAKLHNDWLNTRSQESKAILDELLRQGTNLFGPQTSTGTSNSVSNTDFTEEETPTITPEYQPMAGLQRTLVERRLSSPTALPAGFKETGMAAINATHKGALNDLQNLARRRGVSADTLVIGSPAEQDRRRQLAEFQVQLPLQERELQNQDIGLAQNILQAFGRGSKRQGQSRTVQRGSSTATTPPNISALADLLLTPGPRAATM